MLVCTCVFSVNLPIIPQGIAVNITDLGASVQSADNTVFIQNAIDKVNTAGGGQVIVPEGVFLCGPLQLKSNVDFHLSKGSVLKMLPYGIGNGIQPGSYPNNGKEGVYASLITATDAKNIAVTGSGLLDGQGKDWWEAYRKVKGTSTVMKRGCLIALLGTKNALVSGIKLIDAPNVHITVGKKSSEVTVDGITITCPEDGPNTDGIDVWAPNVVIKNCSISTGDDNIAMDTGTDNIIIKNCFFGHGHGCSIGSYTHNIKNVLVDSCRFEGTDSAVRMKSGRNRGGGESNIVYSNITANRVNCAVYITSYYPKVPRKIEEDTPQEVTPNTPSWSDIQVKNLVATNCNQSIEIWGVPESPVDKVSFENVKIHSKQGPLLYNCSNVNFINSYILNTNQEKARMYRASNISGF